MADPRLLFASSEVYPFAKSGGLADVAYSLPRALRTVYEADVIMPLYQFVDRERFGIEPLGEPFDMMMGGVTYTVALYTCDYEGMVYRFIYTPLLCDREFLYGPPGGVYADNAVRFGLFNYALLEILKQEKYAIVHLNDWQSALLPLLMYDDKTIQTRTLFTIHNLAYQGTFDKDVLKTLGIDEKYFNPDELEFYGQVNFIKAGIKYADSVTTVSPTYAKEIVTPEFGCGLEGFLQHYSYKITGIINGIDTEHFSPEKDGSLIVPYADLRGKAVNKRAYLKEIGIDDPKKPLLIFIGRFTWQKGMDILIGALSQTVLMECNIAILGEGEKKYHDALKIIADRHDNIHLKFGYDESLSHRMYAAADFFLMPSLFEPCGLTQMIAMKYGSVPIVHSIGGLADTVQSYKDIDVKSEKGVGIVFSRPDVDAFLKTIREALVLYRTKARYNKIIEHNMSCDFSWRESAVYYIKQYEQINKEVKCG